MTLITKAAPEVEGPHIPELEDIRKGISRMLKALWPAVEAGEFSVIVGDDTSGRIPTLIAAKVINGWNREHGRPRVPVIFVPGTKNENDLPAQQAHYERCQRTLRKVDRNKRALIVTEGITSGRATNSIGKLLTDDGFGWDVAVLDGTDFEPRTPSGDDERIRMARERSEEQKEALRRGLGILQNQLEEELAAHEHQMSTLKADRDGLLDELSKRKTDLETQVETLLAEELRGMTNWMRRHDRDDKVASLRVEIGACDNDPRIALQEQEIHRLDMAHEVHVHNLRLGISARELELGQATNVNSDVDQDQRAIWPDGSRLFAGGKNAGSIRDRYDLTGRSQDKFGDHLVVRDPDVVRQVRGVRRNIAASVRRYTDGLVYQGEMVLSVFPAIQKLVEQLHPELELGGSYGVIVGDDTSGRLPTLLIAKAINTYLKRQGKPTVPVRFIEGIKGVNNQAQIEAFARLSTWLGEADRSKRALVVTEAIGEGGCSGSIAWRLNDAGFDCDIATLQGGDGKAQGLIESGVWPPRSRVFDAKSNNHVVQQVLDSERASGMKQGREKFTPGMVNHDADIRRAVVVNRRDVNVAGSQIAARLSNSPMVVREIDALRPGIQQVLQALKGAIHGDEFAAIIGQDPAGRIPTLILGQAINKWRSHKGMLKLPVIFIGGRKVSDGQGTVRLHEAALDQQHGRSISNLNGGRALFLSGALHSGGETGVIARWLDRHGVAVDIVPPRGPDHFCQEYIDQGVLPASCRVLSESGVGSYDQTKDGVFLQKHPEVTGVSRGKTGLIRPVPQDLRREVGFSRRMIKQLSASLARSLG